MNEKQKYGLITLLLIVIQWFLSSLVSTFLVSLFSAIALIQPTNIGILYSTVAISGIIFGTLFRIIIRKLMKNLNVNHVIILGLILGLVGLVCMNLTIPVYSEVFGILKRSLDNFKLSLTYFIPLFNTIPSTEVTETMTKFFTS